MNWGLLLTGFGLGTFKFLFAHWAVYAAAYNVGYDITFAEIYISVTAGAWFAMTLFYFSSEYLMRRARIKRLKKIIRAEKKGISYTPKKIFTRANKLIVKIKRGFGIYGITLLAPLFLSIPIGSIICAKFYGTRRKTFPLMILFTGCYSLLICIWIFTLN